MNYVFSLSNGSDSCLYNHTGDIIHAGFFFMTDVGFEPVWMRRRRLALQSTAPLPTALPKLPKKGSSNSTDKDYGLYSTLLIGALMYIFL